MNTTNIKGRHVAEGNLCGREQRNGISGFAKWLPRVVAPFLIALPAGGVAQADSLWTDDGPKAAIADKRATRIGDILTIIVQENSSSTKDKSTKTSKKNSADMSIQSFLYAPAASSLLTRAGNFPALKYNASKDFNGGGSIKNNEQMSARVAVRVIDRLPNGNLIVEGRRLTEFSDEKQ